MWIQVPVHSFSDRVCELRVGPTPLPGDPVTSLLDLLTFFSPLPPSKNPLSRLRVKKNGLKLIHVLLNLSSSWISVKKSGPFSL